MNKKQKIIVSITGIVIVVLALLGLTYAYYLTNIIGNGSTKSIDVTTANLKLVYGDGNGTITATNMEPGYMITKYFTATNEGTKKVDYATVLQNVVNEFTRQQDLEYNLECTIYSKNDFILNSDGTVTGTSLGICDGVSGRQFPSNTVSSIMINNSIDVNQVNFYKLEITYKEMNINQNDDMNKSFSALVNIINAETINPYLNNTNSLAYKIINNAMNNRDNTILKNKPITIPALETAKYKPIVSKEALLPSITEDIPIEDQNFSLAYSDDYNYDILTGNLTLLNYKTGIYSEIYNQLNGKYSFMYDTTSSDNETLYKIIESTLNETSTSTTYSEVIVSGESEEKELAMTPDNYGISYYFRGNVQNNFLNFNNMCWRIVRIEGDGSVKLVLADKDHTCNDTNYSIDNLETSFISKKGTYGFTNGMSAPDFTYDPNNEQSTLYKLNIFLNGGTVKDPFGFKKFVTYEYSGFSDELKNKLKDEIWCLGNVGTKYNGLGIIDNENGDYYEDYIKLYGKNQNKNASLICSESSSSFQNKIGLLNVNEVAFAGLTTDIINLTTYITQNTSINTANALDAWQVFGNSMTPVSFFGINYKGLISQGNNSVVRPSIVLNPDVEATGTGNQNDPYIIS